MEDVVFVSDSGLGEIVMKKYTVSEKIRDLVVESTTSKQR